MERTLGWLGPAFVLAGAIGLLQAHGIAFWSSKLGPYGIAWSLLLEAIALWLWSRPALGNRLLAVLASVLLLLGPLYQVGTPILEGLASAEHSDRARAREIPMVKAEIRDLESQLATFTANSEKRPGWLPAIEATQAQIEDARRRLTALHREAPRNTARIEAQEILVIVMECTGLVLFQISAVLAITALVREGRARRPAEPWCPFGFAGHWGSGRRSAARKRRALAAGLREFRHRHCADRSRRALLDGECGLSGDARLHRGRVACALLAGCHPRG